MDHEHVQPRDPLSDSVLRQTAAFRQAEAQHAAGTWLCPGCGRPHEELPLGHSWGYADGGNCNAAQTG
jgi:hypothetical protein